jgi:hypothetical protein
MRSSLLPIAVALAVHSGAARAAPPAPGGTLKTLLSRHVAFSMVKQLALQDAIGEEKSWGAALSEGAIWFGDGPRHPIQFLGTQADDDRTWLWAWANEASHPPPAVTRASERLRALGEEKGWTELTTPKLRPPSSDGHTIALVACGLLGGASYYRGPYRGGAAYFLLTDFPPKEQVNVRPERLQTAIMTAVSSFEVDHREVVRGLAVDLHLKLVERPGKLLLTAPNGNVLELALDREGRITASSGQLTK